MPFKARESSCVSRTRTRANSAATKNPLMSTSPTTSRIFHVMSKISVILSQAHIAKNDFQYVLQVEDANFTAVTTQNNDQTLTAALHAAQGDFEAEILFEKEGGFDVVCGWAIEIQILLEKKGI